MKLDVYDYKILYELDRDSSQTINQIAKKVRLSKDSVKYRIKKLEKDEVILRYQIYVDHGKLGLSSARINLKLQNTNPQKEKEIIEFIKKQPNVGFFASVEGNIDFIVWILFKSNEELNNFWNKISEKFSNYLQKVDFGIYTKIIHYPRVFLINKKTNDEEFLFTSISEKIDLDKNELKILESLSYNCRMSLVDLSSKIKLSTKTLASKIKNLKNKGVITGSSIILDISKLGYLYYKIYFDFHNLSNIEIKKIDEFVKSNPNVVYRDYVIGGHYLEIEVQVKEERELRSLIDSFKKEFSSVLRDYEVLNYVQEHKMLSMPWVNSD